VDGTTLVGEFNVNSNKFDRQDPCLPEARNDGTRKSRKGNDVLIPRFPEQSRPSSLSNSNHIPLVENPLAFSNPNQAVCSNTWEVKECWNTPMNKLDGKDTKEVKTSRDCNNKKIVKRTRKLKCVNLHEDRIKMVL
jgi:hypothetical protein